MQQDKANPLLQGTEMIARVLRKGKGRLTEERRRLVETVAGIQGHFEAEDIHRALGKGGRGISLTTVYRNLDLLVDAGIIRRVLLQDRSRMQFEYILGKDHHDHLICLDCGARVEFSYPAIDVLQEEAARQHGFVLAGHTLELLGLCPKCQETQEDARQPLSDLAPGTVARIEQLNGEKAMVRRLTGFGLREGCTVKIIRQAPFGGPLLLEDCESKSRIMLSRSMATHVLVRNTDDIA